MKLKEARKLANIDLLILNLIAVAEHSYNQIPKQGQIKFKNVYLKL